MLSSMAWALHHGRGKHDFGSPTPTTRHDDQQANLSRSYHLVDPAQAAHERRNGKEKIQPPINACTAARRSKMLILDLEMGAAAGDGSEANSIAALPQYGQLHSSVLNPQYCHPKHAQHDHEHRRRRIRRDTLAKSG